MRRPSTPPKTGWENLYTGLDLARCLTQVQAKRVVQKVFDAILDTLVEEEHEMANLAATIKEEIPGS